MRYRVRDILLVSSMYDSYIFEEDGRLYELIRKEYQLLNLSHSPELVQVSSGEEAIRLAKRENRFNLIISTQHIDDMPAIEFAQKVRDEKLGIPIVLLGYDNREMIDLIHHPKADLFDKIFIWQGDFRIIFGIIKHIEDRLNIEYDTLNVGVQVIILIEDSIRFYSSYLPLIYTVVVQHAQSLISEGINLSHKFLRMRARPKIILCSDYEDAWKFYKKYEDNVLGIVSDIDFKKKGKQDSKAGIKFAKKVKKEYPDIPILLQSNVTENEKHANEIGASFLYKRSPTLLQELRDVMRDQFSFGEFIFKDKDGEEVGRVKNLRELQTMLSKVPEESIVYHASRNHFSTWLKARTEFWLAHKLRPSKVADYESTKALREDLIRTVSQFRLDRQRGVILDFNKETFDSYSSFARIGGGSIGGKARGLGFINNLL
jgi:CheY-like chemotaxis protein